MRHTLPQFAYVSSGNWIYLTTSTNGSAMHKSDVIQSQIDKYTSCSKVCGEVCVHRRIITLSHKFVDLLNPVQKTIVSNGCNLPFLNNMSLPLTFSITVGKTYITCGSIKDRHSKKNKQELKRYIKLYHTTWFTHECDSYTWFLRLQSLVF